MTSSLELVAVEAAHVPQWHQWRCETSSQAVMPLENATQAELLQRLSRTRSSFDDRSASEYRWMVKVDGALVGTVALRDVSWSHQTAEVAYMLTEAARGKRIGSTAVRRLVERAFHEAGLHRLWLRTTEMNVASRRLAERLGFRHEGTQREQLLLQGRRVNQELYGLLRSEWDAASPSPR